MYIEINVFICYNTLKLNGFNYSVFVHKKVYYMKKFEIPTVLDLLNASAEKFRDSTFIK